MKRSMPARIKNKLSAVLDATVNDQFDHDHVFSLMRKFKISVPSTKSEVSFAKTVQMFIVCLVIGGGCII